MPTHQSAAFAINLIDEENKKAPRPVEAEALPGNAMDDAVMRVIARVEQTFGALSRPDFWDINSQKNGRCAHQPQDYCYLMRHQLVTEIPSKSTKRVVQDHCGL